MTLKELRFIYDNEHSQAGDTDQDFYEWAINYLLEKTEHKKLITEIKRHITGIEKAVEKLESEG